MWFALPLLLFLAADFVSDGMKALDNRDYRQAADLFAKAVAADPSDYAANFHLALSYSLLGQDTQAIPVYKTVLTLKPGLYEAELNLGILLIGQKQAREAVPYLQSASDKKPKEYRPRIYLADALLESGDGGEQAQRGGLLIARYGEGTFIYATYNLHRQLLAANRGAYRIFANMISLPKVRKAETKPQ